MRVKNSGWVVKDAEPHWPSRTLHTNVDCFLFFFVHFNGGDEDTQLPAIWCHEDSLKPRDKKDSDEFTLQIWIAICCELELTLCESLWAARIDAVVLGGCTTMLSLRFWCGCSARTSFSSTQPTGNAGSAQRACWRERESKAMQGLFLFRVSWIFVEGWH